MTETSYTFQQGEEHFQFGKNWSSFLATVGESHILKAVESFKGMIGLESLAGLSFLDIGCGSGLSSLAAARLSAKSIQAFDYDPICVAVTQEMKSRFLFNPIDWQIEQGSALDSEYIKSLGTYDVVYSWGVLHHTGNMYKALENVIIPVKPGGILWIAIYNDQGLASQIWRWVKKTYNSLPSSLRFLIIIPAFIRLWVPRMVYDLLRGKPFSTWNNYADSRGMSAWHDVIDWIGGYPFEVAKPEEIFEFYFAKGFDLIKLKTCGGKLGCNEYIFRKRSFN